MIVYYTFWKYGTGGHIDVDAVAISKFLKPIGYRWQHVEWIV